jgi:hypothetical protein
MAQLGLRKWGSQFNTIEQQKIKREQVRKEKLTALLNQKLHRAFGLTSSHPIIEEEIESFVMNNRGEFSENKLKQLRGYIAEKLAPEGITLKIKTKSRLGSTAAKAAGLGIVGINNTPQGANGPTPLSRGSRHSMSVKSFKKEATGPQSFRKSQMSNRSTSHRSLAESDEWREIQNFNTLLHLEEQNREVQQEKERQRLMKEELDKQIREKKARERQEREAEKQYESLQMKLAKEAEKKERLRLENMKRKIEKDKESRDRQIIMETAIKKGQEEREKAQEAIMVAKLKKELELEKMAYKEQKMTRQRQMKDMIAENSNAQFLAKIAAQKEREEDERIQREIMRKLDEQQRKEANNAKQRKEKQQLFVDKMANDVYSKIEQRHKEEEEKIRRYQEERDMKEKLEQERRLKKQKQEQFNIRETLARQMKDKKQKEMIDREVIEEQAKLWQMDRDQFAKEEAELNKKMKTLSHQNAELLEKQIEEHKAKNLGKGMDEVEYTLNKGYLKGIRQKKHHIIKEEQ